MSRICARPGCREESVATLSYSYADRTVWIDSTSPENDPMNHDLCVHHADTLVLPRGWACRDRRPVASVGGPIEPCPSDAVIHRDRAISA